MPCPSGSVATIRAGLGSLADRFATFFTRFAGDERASTALEYALTLGGIAMSTLGVTSVIGFEISGVFETIRLSFCLELYSVCTAR